MRLTLLALLLAVPLRAATAPYGVLLLAHGGDARWNAEVETLRARVNAKIPAESALGMADPMTLQAGINRLQERGVATIVAVPLFVQSRSEVLDQTRYALKLSDKPSEALREGYARMAAAHAAHAGHGGHAMPAMPAGHAHRFSLERVESKSRLVLASALDDDPFVTGILLERALSLSKKPAEETVILVAHGPADDAAVPAWERSLAAHAKALRKQGKFRRVLAVMLRDDSPAAVRATAVLKLRQLVAGAAGEGRALVVPVLIARGGIETKIEKDLEGLDYAWDGRTLMPHEGFVAWVLARAADAAK